MNSNHLLENDLPRGPWEVGTHIYKPDAFTHGIVVIPCDGLHRKELGPHFTKLEVRLREAVTFPR